MPWPGAGRGGGLGLRRRRENVQRGRRAAWGRRLDRRYLRYNRWGGAVLRGSNISCETENGGESSSMGSKGPIIVEVGASHAARKANTSIRTGMSESNTASVGLSLFFANDGTAFSVISALLIISAGLVLRSSAAKLFGRTTTTDVKADCGIRACNCLLFVRNCKSVMNH